MCNRIYLKRKNDEQWKELESPVHTKREKKKKKNKKRKEKVKLFLFRYHSYKIYLI